MAGKKKEATGIPMEFLLDTSTFGRNFKIEVRSPAANPNVVDAILDMMIEHAHLGRVFKKGRKPGKVGSIRLAIATQLASDPCMKNEALWERIGKKPPKGYEFHDNSLGKYIEGPEADEGMAYARFRNLASEERTKLKK